MYMCTYMYIYIYIHIYEKTVCSNFASLLKSTVIDEYKFILLPPVCTDTRYIFLSCFKAAGLPNPRWK